MPNNCVLVGGRFVHAAELFGDCQSYEMVQRDAILKRDLSSFFSNRDWQAE